MILTPRLLEILQHALGMDKYGKREKYSERNHFCAGGTDVPDCAELVALGYMRSFRRSWLPYFNCVVTAEGMEAVRRESPAPPKLTRSQKRYRRWLEVADAAKGPSQSRRFRRELRPRRKHFRAVLF